MQTIIETPIFIQRAKSVGVSDQEHEQIIMTLAHTPDAGDVMPGTGGARKLRVAARGRGKSGGYRVITFYSGKDIPVFLLDIYAKNEKINLTQNEKMMLKKLLNNIVDIYRRTDS